MTAKQKDHLMEFDKKVLDHTLHDWMDAVRNAVHDIRPGMYIIAGVERHRQPILDATLEMLEVAGPVNPNVIPKHPVNLQKRRFQDFYHYGRLAGRDEAEEAFALALYRPVVMEMHVQNMRSVFRRLTTMFEAHDMDIGLIRGICCLTGVPSANGEAIVKDIRFFENEKAVLATKTEEFKNDADRYFVGDGLRTISTSGISIEDLKFRFRRDGVVEQLQSLCAA
jgi:hypothetical protein